MMLCYGGAGRTIDGACAHEVVDESQSSVWERDTVIQWRVRFVHDGGARSHMVGERWKAVEFERETERSCKRICLRPKGNEYL